MNKTTLRASLLRLAVLFLTQAFCPAQDPDRPNVVLIMADDLGYGDVAYNGHPRVQTPALDALAREGVRLDRFYSAAPVCSPTRASCLTGRHPFRVGIQWAASGHIGPDESTIAEVLGDGGYATAHCGKWHLGGLSRTVRQTYVDRPVDASRYSPPWENGYQVTFACENTVPTFNPGYLTSAPFGEAGYRMVMDRPVTLDQRHGGFEWRDRFWTGPGQFADEDLSGPLPKILTDRALTFAEEQTNAQRPFFVTLWFSSPHTPVVAGPKYRKLYPNCSIEEQHWLGCISAMDEQIGRLRSELKRLGVLDDTLLWFCSDNGPTWVHDHASAGPLRGGKGTLWEGGIRVPSVLSWPGRLAGGRALDAPIVTSDFYPTVLAATGVPAPNERALDGINVLPLLEGRREQREEPIGFVSPRLLSDAQDTQAWSKIGGRQMAWLDGDRKLLSRDEGKTWQLFDLAADPSEALDLSALYPKEVARMRAAWQDWYRSVEDESNRRVVRIVRARSTPVTGVERAPDCYHQFREGGAVVTKSGRVVFVAQGREQSAWSDRSGQDLVCRFSDDNGDTWSPAALVAAAGDFSICPNAVVYDAISDAVHVLYNVFQWNYQEPDTRKAMKGRECRQFQVTSGDGGRTWSPPRELTDMLGSGGQITVFGSGEGIQLRQGEFAGRLVVPGGFDEPWGNRMFYSDDHGETWKVGERAPREHVTEANVRLECKVAELGDGTLVLNARCTPHRARAFSKDGGVTWTPQELDEQLQAVSCNGSLISVQEEGQTVLLLSVPTGPQRTHGTVYASTDGGRTWPTKKTLVEGKFAYSSLVQLLDGRVALIFESENHKHLDLLRFRVEDLVDK